MIYDDKKDQGEGQNTKAQAKNLCQFDPRDSFLWRLCGRIELSNNGKKELETHVGPPFLCHRWVGAFVRCSMSC